MSIIRANIKMLKINNVVLIPYINGHINVTFAIKNVNIKFERGSMTECEAA